MMKRRVILIIPFALVFIVCSFFLLNSNASDNTRIVTRDYWILNDGYLARFSNGLSISHTYTNFASYGNLFQITYSNIGSQFQNYDASGNLFHYGYQWSDGSYYKVYPSAKWFPDIMEVGQTYTSSFQRREYDTSGNYHGLGNENLQITVSGPESIVVTAGTFAVYKVSIALTWSDSWGESGNYITDYWLAKNTGIVKMVRSGQTYELQSVSGLPEADWETIQGTVTYNGTPLCAMILANGEYMFSCDPDGEYELYVPLDDNGEITLFAFVDGLAPFKITSAPSFLPSYIEMEPATPDSQKPAVTATKVEGDISGWATIAGSVSLDGIPLCAMVLANGEYMFSCDPDGEYGLEVPLDGNGQITLFVFVDGLSF